MSNSDSDQHLIDTLARAAEFEQRAASNRRRAAIAILVFCLLALVIAGVSTFLLYRQAKKFSGDATRARLDFAATDKANKELQGKLDTVNSELTTKQTELKSAQENYDKIARQIAIKTDELKALEENQKAAKSLVTKAAAEAITQADAFKNFVEDLVKLTRTNPRVTPGEVKALAEERFGNDESLSRFKDLATGLVSNQLTAKQALETFEPAVPVPTGSQNATFTVQFLFTSGLATPEQQNGLTTAFKQAAVAKEVSVEVLRRDVQQSRTMTEVRYYRHPEDRESAEKILSLLPAGVRAKARVSFVIDPQRPPPGTFQIAVSRSAFAPEQRAMPWSIRIHFGLAGSIKTLSVARERLEGGRQTTVGKPRSARSCHGKSWNRTTSTTCWLERIPVNKARRRRRRSCGATKALLRALLPGKGSVGWRHNMTL